MKQRSFVTKSLGLALFVWFGGLIIPQVSATELQQAPANPTQTAFAELQRYFFAAARTGELAVLQEFLQAGYPVDEPNPQSYTALMVAAYGGQGEAVELLLAAGADACIRDKRGHTALMGAMLKAEWAIARTLFKIDCDAASTAKATDQVVDKQQMTAAQFAEIYGQTDKFIALDQPESALSK